MRKEDCLEIFDKIPAAIHAQTNLVLKNACILAIDAIARFEDNYILIRGREGGTTDEGRSFFVPYEDITYIKIERILKVGDLKRMYGEGGTVAAAEAEAMAAAAEESTTGTKEVTIAADVMTPAPVASPSQDPAAIAKQNLLDRIRNARTNTLSGIRGK
jgi:hypothetical protein